MFFVFGTRRKATPICQMERPCTKCARPTIHSAFESKQWFTLFFIPVIPLGASYAIRCNLCGLALKATPELKQQLRSKTVPAIA
jgi:hypothetical protein